MNAIVGERAPPVPRRQSGVAHPRCDGERMTGRDAEGPFTASADFDMAPGLGLVLDHLPHQRPG